MDRKKYHTNFVSNDMNTPARALTRSLTISYKSTSGLVLKMHFLTVYKLYYVRRRRLHLVHSGGWGAF